MRIIESVLETWGSLSQLDQFKRTRCIATRLIIGFQWRTYDVIKHGTNFYKNFFEWRKQLNSDNPAAVDISNEVFIEEKVDVPVKLPSKRRSCSGQHISFKIFCFYKF